MLVVDAAWWWRSRDVRVLRSHVCVTSCAREDSNLHPVKPGQGPQPRQAGKLKRLISEMDSERPEHLRVLIANERRERLETTTQIVARMGHEVVARELDVKDVAAATAELRPDVALVGLGESSEHALELISRIVQEATCPVIALLEVKDSEFVNEAAKRGIFAYVEDGDKDQLQSSLDIVLRRFAEYHNLEGAFGRRAMTERAKGILMERHSLDEHAAFEMLRNHSRKTGRKLIDVAEAVVDSHVMLPAQPSVDPQQDGSDSKSSAKKVPRQAPSERRT
jgi:response regulator NasT